MSFIFALLAIVHVLSIFLGTGWALDCQKSTLLQMC